MTNQDKAIEAVETQDWAQQMIAKRKANANLPYNRELARIEREETEAEEYETGDDYER